MVSRPVDAGQARSWGRGGADGLLGLDWVPIAVPVSPVAPASTQLSASSASAASSADAAVEWLFVPAGQRADQVADVAWSVLEQVQAWLTNEVPERLVVVTRGAVGDTVENLAGAAVWGLIRSVQSEHPGRLILLDADPTSTTDTDELAAVVAALGDEEQAALRDGAVLVPRLIRMAAPAPADADEAGAVWDQDGTVLVTGGTGGLGRHVVRHLATAHGIRSMLILSRSGPSSADALTLVQELAELGVRVRMVAGDVADRDTLAELIAAIPSRWPLRGVVHVAGLADDAVALSLTHEQLTRVLRVKVDAVWALHELTADLPLTAFITFSSAAAILGAGGQANYAAANAFLDAFATWRRAQRLPATSLAWGLWDEERGLGGRLTSGDRKRLQRLAAPLSVEQGLSLFDLATGSTLAIPLRLNLAFARTMNPVPPLLRALVRTTPAASPAPIRPSARRPATPSPPVSPRSTPTPRRARYWPWSARRPPPSSATPVPTRSASTNHSANSGSTR
ncbi:SDR family NAD(P)-dependent oxidoreductase [Catenulispora yoronensis]